MDILVPKNYMPVPEDILQDISWCLDGYREAYNNALVYKQRHNKATFGYKMNDGRCFVDPSHFES